MIYPIEYEIVTLFGVNGHTGNRDALNNCFFVKNRIESTGGAFYSKKTGSPVEVEFTIASWEYAPQATIKLKPESHLCTASLVDWRDDLAG